MKDLAFQAFFKAVQGCPNYNPEHDVADIAKKLSEIIEEPIEWMELALCARAAGFRCDGVHLNITRVPKGIAAVKALRKKVFDKRSLVGDNEYS